MNELQIFENQDFGKIRTVLKDGEAWFVGKDVAQALGYANPTKAAREKTDDEDKGMSKMDTPSGVQETLVINESGLYALVLSSKLDTAKAFRRWITKEVIPAIRKHGMYAVDELIENPDLAIAALTALKEEREKNARLQDQNDEMKPKALFADSVAASSTSILVGELAKLLRQNGVNVGQNRLFEILRRDGYLMARKGADYNMPTQRSMEAGWMEVKERAINNPDGTIRVTKTPRITGKGQVYFINKYLNEQTKGETT